MSWGCSLLQAVICLKPLLANPDFGSWEKELRLWQNQYPEKEMNGVTRFAVPQSLCEV